jgi:hypothetical protein
MTEVRYPRAWSPSYTISGSRGCDVMSFHVKCVVSYLTGAGVVMKGGCVRVKPWSSEDKRGGVADYGLPVRPILHG